MLGWHLSSDVYLLRGCFAHIIRVVKRPTTGHTSSKQKQMQLEKKILSWVYTCNLIMRKAETGGLKVQTPDLDYIEL